MKAGVLLALAKIFASLSLLAVGGANATTPEIQRIVVDRQHWMTTSEFSQSFAIAQAAPGPNVMLVSLIGWRVAGPAGLMVATVCMNAPSAALAFVVGRGWRRWSNSPWLSRLQRTLGPIAAGLITASGAAMARSSDKTAAAICLTAGMGAFILLTRRSPLWGLAAAGAAGVALHRMGVR